MGNKAKKSQSRMKTKEPPDGGFGWILVAANFLNMMISCGVSFLFGLFYTDIKDTFDVSDVTLSSMISTQATLCFIIALPGGILSDRLGCRTTNFIGSVLLGIGYFMASFSTNITMFCIGYSVLGGLGAGLHYISIIISMQKYFKTKLAFSLSIVNTGVSLGTFAFAPLIVFLLDSYGWRGAMLIFTGIILHGCVFASMIRPLPTIGNSPAKCESSEYKSKRQERKPEIKQSKTKMINQHTRPAVTKEAISSHNIDDISKQTVEVRHHKDSTLYCSDASLNINLSQSQEVGQKLRTNESLGTKTTHGNTCTLLFHCKSAVCDLCDIEIITNVYLIAFLTPKSAASYVQYFLYNYTPLLCEETGLEKSQISIIMSLMAAGGIIGRFSSGVLSIFLDATTIYTLVLLFIGTCCFVMSYLHSFLLLMALAFLSAFFVGVADCMPYICLREFFPQEKWARCSGLLCFSTIIGASTFGTVTGSLYDVRHSYQYVFQVTTAVPLSAFLSLLVVCILRKFNYKLPEQRDQERIDSLNV